MPKSGKKSEKSRNKTCPPEKQTTGKEMPEANFFQKTYDVIEAKKGTDDVIPLYREIIAAETTSEHDMKIKETAIYELGELYAKQQKADQIVNLLSLIRPFFNVIPKARTAKIVRKLIELVAVAKGDLSLQIDLCKQCIDWCKEENRSFLRQRVEARLALLYYENDKCQESLNMIKPLLKEVKKLEDKLLMVEIELVEAYVYHKLKNIPKAKAALTAARTAANTIYIPPLLQAQIDMMSGVLHAEEKDYETAFSYFYESFEAFNTLDNPKALPSLKCMLLCKIMTNNPNEVTSILSGKVALTYSGREIDAMRAIADAHKARSLKLFEDALKDYKKELEDDLLIKNHLSALYDTMIQQNLCKIIEPYSRIEIKQVAKLIGLQEDFVERKLSQMVLDKKFSGILDQGNNCLILFEASPPNQTYNAALDTIEFSNKVVDSLFEKAKELR